MKKMRMIAFIFVYLMGFSLTSNALNIGIQAPRGAIKTLVQWEALRQYLQTQLAREVKIIPLNPAKTLQAVKSRKITYLLSNPVLALILIHKHSARPLVTLNRKTGSHLAGVIIASHNSGIKSSKELVGKHVMAFKYYSAAAFVFQMRHMLDQGIDPYRDFSSFREAKRQDEIVLAVKNDLIDAGFIKSGLLESMISEGKLKREDIRVLDERSDDFTLIHSTQLYPEWTMTALSFANPETDLKLKKALQQLTPEHPACEQADINGFVEPINADELTTTLKKIKLL